MPCGTVCCCRYEQYGWHNIGIDPQCSACILYARRDANERALGRNGLSQPGVLASIPIVSVDLVFLTYKPLSNEKDKKYFI